MTAAALGPPQRADALARLSQEVFDVLVIGGGVTGAGTALDAATRGLSVGLVEARDYAAGTSSRSSKLIHGGLRYLEQGNFALVRQALIERRLLLERLAPHLVRPVSFVLPLTHRGWERAYLGAGVALYDALGGSRHLPRHRHLTRAGARRLVPALRAEALVGGIELHDAQVDDARYTVTLARTAATYGAVVAASLQVEGFLRDGERVVGARVRDQESGAAFDVRSRQTINATGVWTDDLQDLVGGRGRFRVRASKGVHLVVPRDRIFADCGLLLRTSTSVLFVIPWGRHWIIGTTDTDWDLDKAHPAASRADIDYLLDHLNSWVSPPLTRADVQGVYAGLRPLLAGESESTSSLSREHVVAQPVPGLTAVAGGKYTTYRLMAADVVDAALRELDHAPRSCTADIPLVGAVGYPALHNQRARLAERAGLHAARIEHLLGRYGSAIEEVLALVAGEPGLARAIPGAEDYLQAEARYAVTHEGGLHLDDVLTRRTRISIETWDRGLSAAPAVARLMAPVLGWSEQDIDREVEHYRARVRAERQSQEQDDDQTADAVRMGAPEVRLGAGARR